MMLKPKALAYLFLFSIALQACSIEDRRNYTFETVWVELADGLTLSTDLYLPKGGGKFPVVFIRTPYNKAHPMGKPSARPSRSRALRWWCRIAEGAMRARASSTHFAMSGKMDSIA